MRGLAPAERLLNLAKGRYFERLHCGFAGYTGLANDRQLMLSLSVYRSFGEAPEARKIAPCKGERVEIFLSVFLKKILPEPCMEQSPLGDIEGASIKMLLYQ